MGRSVGLPTPARLARTFVGFARECEAPPGVPPLALWSNLLRPLAGGTAGDAADAADAGPVPLRDMPRLARLSRRQTGPLVTVGDRWGLLTVDRSGGRGKATARLTERGAATHASGAAGIAAAEAAWEDRFRALVPRLRASLAALVDQLALELPWFPTSYGAADNTFAGGRLVPAEPGPPALPPHGADWRPVRRDPTGSATGLPLSALLSQAIVAFAIEYEAESPLELSLATGTLLQAIGEDGVRATDVPHTGAHGILAHDPTAAGRAAITRLTERGRALRNAHAPLVEAIERRWRDRYGADLIDAILSSAAAIADDVGPGPVHERVVSLIAELFPVQQR